MKTRISVTIDPEVEKKIDKIMQKRRYRNKSHFVEEAIREKIEMEEKNGRK